MKRQPRPIDGIGLGLIALGLGCLEIMMDRGEDADWFGSSFIVIMAMLSVTGLVGAAVWLSVAKKPIISLAIFKDKNFTGGCIMIGCVGAILYASSVIIPQYAQQVLGYTATWAGMILSPGGVIIIILIPFVGRLMNVMQTRYIIAIGFFLLGVSFIYSSKLVLDITYLRLVMIRSSQTVGLAFLFVPISTITYSTLPRELNGDATALFSMFRNVAGSIGIASSTAMIQQRSQVHQTYLSQWASPFWQPFKQSRRQLSGRTPGTWTFRFRRASAGARPRLSGFPQAGFGDGLFGRLQALLPRCLCSGAALLHAIADQGRPRRRRGPLAPEAVETHRTIKSANHRETPFGAAAIRLNRIIRGWLSLNKMRLITGTSLALLLTGCAVGPNFVPPNAGLPPTSFFAGATHKPIVSTRVAIEPVNPDWWALFVTIS